MLREFFVQFGKPLLYFAALGCILLISIPLFTYASVAKDIHNKQFLMNGQNAGLVLLDSDGNQFFSFDSKNISFVPLAQIPTSFQQAVTTAEDKDFYQNPGFSISGMARALVADLTSGSLKEGGSTITQQLVKNALLSPQKNFLRKYQEIVFAYLVTRRYSKQDILEMYCNSAYFGEGAFGVENAAETYFGVHAQDLTLAQATLLVSLIPAPSARSPLSNNHNIAKKNQEEILAAMQQDGYITKDQEKLANDEELMYNPQKPQENVLAPHFALMVRDELYKKYGEENVIRSGLRVKTTLNRSEQQYAETVVQNQVAHLSGDGVTNGAAVVMDPKTGEVLALVGSHDWFDPNNGKVNMALSPRQPGSSFKPIIYSAAFSQRLITPATILDDVPTTFTGNYKPHDYDGKYRGPVTVRRALANSLNIPAVEVMEKVGVEQGISQAEMLGIDTLKDPSNYGLAFVLGAANVPLLELTNAYATFADQGMYHPPTDILEIHDKYGRLVDTNKNEGQQVMDGGTAFLISSILSDNKARAEEFGNALTIPRPAAVKTGTTDNFRDALTIGYTPSLVVGAWVGNNDNAPMDNVAGSLGAAPIWRSLMGKFLANTPVEQFTPPPDIVQTAVCAQFASTKSPRAATTSSEYFLSGTEPQNSGCTIPSAQPSEEQPTFIFPTEPGQTTQPTFYPPSPIPTEAPIDTPTMPPLPTIEITIPPFQEQF